MTQYPWNQRHAIAAAGISKEQLDAGPRSLDKEHKRKFFVTLLSVAKSEDESGKSRCALEDAAISLASNSRYSYLREVFFHEILIRQFAERYADETCLKNGLRGTECTQASRRKVIQRRLNEFLSDNVDPFHKDEPYHNEELYQELKKNLVESWVHLRKYLVGEEIAAVKKDAASRGQQRTDQQARQELIERLACSYSERNASECKNSENAECMPQLVARKRRELETNYEALYQEIKQKYAETDPRVRAPKIVWFLPIEKYPAPSGFDEAAARKEALEEVARVYERPKENEEYAEQESTKSYRLHFANNGGKSYNIRYKQNTSSSFDADELNYVEKDTPVYEVVHYSPRVDRKNALVDLRFYFDDRKPTPTIDSANNSIAQRVERQIPEAKGKVRVSFYVKHLNPGSSKREERDYFWVKLTDSTPASESKHLEIKLALRPIITALTIDQMAVPDDSKGSQVTIQGINLQTVQKVTVAGQEADIVGTPGSDTLVVSLKKGVFIKENDGVKIPVSLTAKDGSTATAVITVKASEVNREENPGGRLRKTVKTDSYRKR